MSLVSFSYITMQLKLITKLQSLTQEGFFFLDIFDKSYQEQHRESDLVVVVEAVEAGAPFLGAG